MKNLFLLAICFCVNIYFAQVLEKPQLVEKRDTNNQVVSKVIEVEVPPIEATEIWTTVDIAESRNTPEFPGGQDSLDRYVKEKVEAYIFADTSESFPFGESVYVAFVIATDGTVKSPIIELGYNAALDTAALDIVRNMPKWSPAIDENGTPIESSYRLQILFDFDIDMDEDFDFEDELAYGKPHWTGFEIGAQMNTTGFLDLNNTFATAPYWENNISKSLVLNLNSFQHKFSLIKDVFGITTGYGFSFNNTELTSSYILQHTDSTTFALTDTTQVFKRNSLYAAYLTVPLLLDFTTNKSFSSAFYLNAGVVGGVRLYSHQRLTGKYANGDKFENTTKSDFNLNTWMLDATVRVGYGPFGVFANYAILSMFKEGVTTGVYPLRFGISFSIPL
ncbi:MAG: energy transducer TonB [Sphingomonadales bacterium]